MPRPVSHVSTHAPILSFFVLCVLPLELKVQGEIRDNATDAAPHQYASGTVHVLVNGRCALRDGAIAGMLAGRPLRRGSG